MTTHKVDPRKLVFSPWNVNSVSPENQTKLEESIRRNGIFRPVVVREVGGELQIIAGEHTTKAAIALGYAEIDIYNLGAISEEKAKQISVADNQHYGVEDSMGLAELLKSFEAPAEFLPMSEDDLTAIFKTVEIDLDTLGFEDDEEPETKKAEESLAKAPVEFQIMRFKVPIGSAEFVTRCIQTIARRQGIKSGDSMADAGDALVHLCKSSTE